MFAAEIKLLRERFDLKPTTETASS